MNAKEKERLEYRIVKKVSDSILYKIDSFDSMSASFWDARNTNKGACIPTRSESDRHTQYAFEAFYYHCLGKWEKGELN